MSPTCPPSALVVWRRRSRQRGKVSLDPAQYQHPHPVLHTRFVDRRQGPLADLTRHRRRDRRCASPTRASAPHACWSSLAAESARRRTGWAASKLAGELFQDAGQHGGCFRWRVDSDTPVRPHLHGELTGQRTDLSRVYRKRGTSV